MPEWVGVGARHLGRLFDPRVGASPARVAKTARVRRAKCLLDGTDLPVADVALRSGFGSLRRSTPFAPRSTGGRRPQAADGVRPAEARG